MYDCLPRLDNVMTDHIGVRFEINWTVGINKPKSGMFVDPV